MAKPRTVTTTGGSPCITFSTEDLREIGLTTGDRAAYTVDEESGEIRVFAAEISKRT